MFRNSWLRNQTSVSTSVPAERNRSRSTPFRAAIRSRPRLEFLEDRTLLSAASFTAPANYAAGGGNWSVAVGDFNGDGKPDLAVANADGNSTVSVLLNK